ncbi:TetR/AcrR family transcriptional regulator [Methylophaga sp. OBS4]|nr:TetR/AcrR family transcriptional regulator [Methylophaga sp. OBS4]
MSQATLQFWHGGYAATSLQDLLNCMHLSKSSLYQSFGNKEQLFVRCLEHYQQQLGEDLTKQLQQTGSGLGFIRDLLASVTAEASSAQRKGCLLVNTANETACRQPAIAQAVNRGFGTIRSVITQALIRAREQGELAVDSDVEQLSDFLVSGISGLRTMVKAGMDKEKLDKVAAMLLATLK